MSPLAYIPSSLLSNDLCFFLSLVCALVLAAPRGEQTAVPNGWGHCPKTGGTAGLGVPKGAGLAVPRVVGLCFYLNPKP